MKIAALLSSSVEVLEVVIEVTKKTHLAILKKAVSATLGAEFVVRLAVMNRATQGTGRRRYRPQMRIRPAATCDSGVVAAPVLWEHPNHFGSEFLRHEPSL